MTLYVQAWDGRRVAVAAPSAAAPSVVSAWAASTAGAVVPSGSDRPIPVAVTADGASQLAGVELAAVLHGQQPQWRPATLVAGQTCLLAHALAPGRYTLMARVGAIVLTAGTLIVDA